MADAVSPDDARAHTFDVVRRGYDRSQVDEIIASLADRIDELESAVEDIEGRTLAIGIDDREALANELHRIGDDVASILESARSAAEGVRNRAAADADRWRSEARSEADELLAEAREQSQSMRASAWNEGSSLLSSATGEAKSILAAAQEETLFMRAEAERDALRLTSDARRDKDEALRSARQEADAIVEDARRESEGVLAAAQKQADVAQERARALEDRRSELIAELEATRESISALEHEIDSRRQELEEPEPEPEPVDEGVRHGDDVGSVKIVAGSRAIPLKPVDPDELVAEVEAMRAAATEPLQAETVAVISPPMPETPHEVPAQDQPETTADDDVAEDPAEEPPPESVDQGDESPPVDEPAATEANHVVEQTAEAPAADPQPKSLKDDISSLFERLRSDPDPDPQETVPPSGKAKQDAVAEVSPDSGPDVRSNTVTTTETVIAEEPEARSEADDVATPDPESSEPENALLAARNAALKTIKRSLVELQNEALEALRVDEDWLPDDTFMDRFEPGFDRLAEDVEAVDSAAAAREFAADLQDAVTSAIEHARESGQGSRAVASAASRVFRTWRSDEAERRLRRA